MYHVYIIQSKTTKDVYIGYTSNLEKRLEFHNSGESKSTKFGIPWEFIYYESYRSKKDAINRERKLKHHGNSKRFLKQRIQNSLL